MKQRYNKTAVVINVVINTNNVNIAQDIVMTHKLNSDLVQSIINQVLNAVVINKTKETLHAQSW
jgi:hypothetical protein